MKFNWIVVAAAIALIAASMLFSVLYVPADQESLTPEQEAQDALDDAKNLRRDTTSGYTP